MKRTRMTEDEIRANQEEARRRMKTGTRPEVIAAKEKSERAPVDVNRALGTEHYGDTFKTVKDANGHVEHVYGNGDKVDMGKPKDSFVAGKVATPPEPPRPPAPTDQTGQRPAVGSGGMRTTPKIPGMNQPSVSINVQAPSDGGMQAPEELHSLVKAMKARKRG